VEVKDKLKYFFNKNFMILMKNKEKDLWRYISSEYNLKNIFELKMREPNPFNLNQTKSYNVFNIHINRAMILYEDILQKEKSHKNEYITNVFKYYLPYELIIILLITSLENYLNDQFRAISTYIKLKNINKKDFRKFSKVITLSSKIHKNLNYDNNPNLIINNILPDQINFQNKEIIKICYKIIGINIYKLDKILWEKILTDNDAYIQIRHKIIHKGFIGGIKYYNNLFNLEFIERCIIDIISFIFNIEIKFLEKFPRISFPKLYFNK